MTQPSLFDPVEEVPLCHCIVGRRTGDDGYTLIVVNSIYKGMWVHARCGKPSHPHTEGKQ